MAYAAPRTRAFNPWEAVVHDTAARYTPAEYQPLMDEARALLLRAKALVAVKDCPVHNEALATARKHLDAIIDRRPL